LTIVIDPGHNGGNASHPEEINRLVPAGANGTTKPCNTTGTETDDGQLTEAQFNFDVARVLEARLRAQGARVVMTRTDNHGVGPCVNERAAIGNKAKADVAISIHADGNLVPDAHGFDVIHPTSEEMVKPATAGIDRRLAVKVRDALVEAGIPTANYVGQEGLDERDDLAGLNLSTQPTVLVELGNMRSAPEANKLESAGYRARLARALEAGIRQFIGET
jgi:N-acetylmuramoyl-L-alanine amidase